MADWDKQSYWREVKRIADTASREARETGGDVYVFVDEAVEDSAWLNHERKVVAHSENKNAFHQWEPGDVEEGSDIWWAKRAFYAMAQDVYARLG